MKSGMSFCVVGAAVCALLGCSRGGGAAEKGIPAAAAEVAFKQADALCRAEGGRMWGQSLCGPMMFADRATHQAVLNGPSPGAVRDGALYRLDLPPQQGIANTATELGGKRWTMIMWPLPEDPTTRAVLMMHESFHRIQRELGLQGSGGLGTNSHLDTREGRIWMRAQFHALATALQSSGEARSLALADALRFEAYRRSLWPGAASEERGLELNEGLAESTGIDAAISDASLRIKAALADLSSCEASPSFVRSFAYGTGSAYAELLDAVEPAWRKGVRGDFEFGAAAAGAYGLPAVTPSKESAEAALAKYGGAEILAQEDARQKTLEERNARFTKLFLEGPTVSFHLEQMSITFNPRGVASFEGHGTVYGTLKISDLWGALEVDDGAALISKDFREVFVPVEPDTAPGHVAGKGWTATLTQGYALVPDPARPGSFKVAKR